MESSSLTAEALIGLMILQATGALCTGLAAAYMLRNHPARAHRALTLTLVAVIALPGATLAVRGFGLGLLRENTPVPASGSATVSAQTPLVLDTEEAPQGSPPASTRPETIPDVTHHGAAGGFAWRRVASWIWGAGSLLVVLYFAASFLGGLRILRSAKLVSAAPYTEGAREASENLGLTVTPTVFASAAVRCPSVWCWRVHPALLVPHVDTPESPDTDWAALFTHELAHYVRRDHLADLLSALVLALLPWHPLAWWARNRLALLSEDACDDWALTRNGADAAGYAESLLHVAVQPRPAFVQAAASNKGHLLRRIRRITSPDAGFRPRVGRTWAACASLLLVCLVAALAVAQPRATTAEDPKTVTSTSTAPADDSPMQRALKLGKALSDQREDEKAAAAIRKELEQLAGTLKTGKNLLKNSDFEKGEGLVPEPWTVRQQGLIAFEWSKGLGLDDSRGVHIVKKEGKFPYATIVQTIPAPSEDRLVRLSARVKTSNVGKAVLDLLFLDEKGAWVYHIWVHTIGEPWKNGTHDWKEYTGYAYVPPGTKNIEVSAQMYWPGELWLDDIELREVTP
ncbi:MAG: M56 family metallopeptidase [Candidatus Hydrogenedentes bacterium]|nr:M56 family metallopeptidase [Candidatus Hydrogenedentota bacterium]